MCVFVCVCVRCGEAPLFAHFCRIAMSQNRKVHEIGRNELIRKRVGQKGHAEVRHTLLRRSSHLRGRLASVKHRFDSLNCGA